MQAAPQAQAGLPSSGLTADGGGHSRGLQAASSCASLFLSFFCGFWVSIGRVVTGGPQCLCVVSPVHAAFLLLPSPSQNP